MSPLTLLETNVPAVIYNTTTMAHGYEGADVRFCGPQPGTSRSCKTSELDGVPVYSPAVPKLYCLMTAANVFEQLVEGCTRQCSGLD